MLLALSVSLATYSGCARHDENSHALDKSHLRSITVLYGLATTKLGHLPHDEKEFKQAIATLSLKPEKWGVASFDEVFVSERDGKPLVVVYGTPPGKSDVVVYEQTGVNDKILVGHRIGFVDEVDQAQFNGLAVRKQ